MADLWIGYSGAIEIARMNDINLYDAAVLLFVVVAVDVEQPQQQRRLLLQLLLPETMLCRLF